MFGIGGLSWEFLFAPESPSDFGERLRSWAFIALLSCYYSCYLHYLHYLGWAFIALLCDMFLSNYSVINYFTDIILEIGWRVSGVGV